LKGFAINTQEIIDMVSEIEDKLDKEVNAIEFSEIYPDIVKQIVFVPDFYYDLEPVNEEV
jgi:hypothetical protein